MYLLQTTAFLVLLLHQCIAKDFNIFDLDIGFNYLNREIDSVTSSFAPESEIRMKWILQELDHFNSKDRRNWQMKFFEHLGYWRNNGPIYLFLGGEGAISHRWARSGIMHELARETHGAMYITEHRYYGDSKPFMNLDADNIKYLSSRQALADIAQLVFHLKSLPMYKDSKVVVIGGSYSGNLAVWMKALYPKLVDAAIASSSPVLAQKNFYEFLEKVKDNYEQYGGTDCVGKISKKFKYYDAMLQRPQDINQLKIDENICDASDMTVLENQQLFFYDKMIPFIYNSVHGILNRIKSHCGSLKDENDYNSSINKHLKMNNFESESCTNYDFDTLISDLHEQRNFNDMYLWLYQTCTEFGYYQTTSSKDQPFSNVPLELYIKICSGVFGNNYNENRVDKGVEKSNKLYGGLKPNVTNVIFTNGDMDPWSTISVLKDLSYDAEALVIPGLGHCQDLLPEKKTDSEELKEARYHLKYTIKKWIGAEEYLN